ncbi:MAG TPA: YetF domain-containing protein [Kofleriaceae bacterium]|nr:YetF domain-containing protein [Kofleriaceae bacterium]
METILRTVAVYGFLLVVFRLAGKRAMAETDTFDFVVLLIVSEATQQALVGDDFSLTTSFIVITTLIGCGLVLAAIKQRSNAAARLLDGLPVILIKDGVLLHDRMDKLKVDEEDIIEAAREQEGIATLEEIRYAVLERHGQISIIPRR